MTIMSNIQAARCDARIDALKAEFGAILAARILEAEALDFLWEARVCERYLGSHEGLETVGEDADVELSRIAILSILDGDWRVAMCVVDGEGSAVELCWTRRFDDVEQAHLAFRHAC